jgi:signal transduction histidine kinase
VPSQLEKATGDRIFYNGASFFPGQVSGLRLLPQKTFDWRVEQVRVFSFRPPGFRRTYLAVSSPLRVGDRSHKVVFGALVVATPKAVLTSRLTRLMERLAIAFGVGVAVAGALGWYLSRRITSPVRKLATAADAVALGRYDVAVPEVPGRDEIAHLADRFRQMAVRLKEAEQRERTFLMTVSHELRTPLTAIRGHVEALREGLAEDPALRAASLDVIAAEAERLGRLVGDVLDLAKLNAHRFTVMREEVDMGRVVDQAYASFAEEARRRGIDYREDVTARPTVISDGDRILQIITNLLANAFRWTPDGGRIDVALGTENGTIHVGVRDTGPGIAADQREQIFRPFVTQDGGGTGLGLAIARELTVALGGRIQLESQPGEGSRFELLLPARRG